ncbi:MAG TPA: hypothetical protein VJV03_08065 [Pyrinomonadaceae bacterium]|nr:hypothetical protein [Pyrinomonadaceae bacterium]
MKKRLTSFINAYREYKLAKSKSKAYRALRNVIVIAVAGYLLLLSFPQVLFANEVSHGNFKVYSREPFDQNIYQVLDDVNSKLAASPINDPSVKPKIFLTSSHRMYACLSLYVGGNSFGKGFAMLPTSNIFINKSDVTKDLVYRRAAEHGQRSLSGVLAHETTHLLIKKKFGYWRNLMIPVWKKEGYSEYVAGGSTLPYETGVKMWKANPGDGTGYQYFKYYMIVKYLLEHEKVSVEELFNRDFEMESLAETVLKTL